MKKATILLVSAVLIGLVMVLPQTAFAAAEIQNLDIVPDPTPPGQNVTVTFQGRCTELNYTLSYAIAFSTDEAIEYTDDWVVEENGIYNSTMPAVSHDVNSDYAGEMQTTSGTWYDYSLTIKVPDTYDGNYYVIVIVGKDNVACRQWWTVYDSSSSLAFTVSSSVVTVTGQSIAPGGVSAGQQDVGILKLSLITDTGTATWTAIKVDRTGTGNDGDVSNVEVWVDGGNGSFDAGSVDDTKISSGTNTFSSSTVNISLTSQSITATSKDYFISYNISDPVSDPANTVGAELDDKTYITVTSPATVSTSHFPIQSSDCSLPVELTSFIATDSAGVVIVRWVVESEVNNAWFYLFRSTSLSGDYIRIAQIPGRGNASSRYEYCYIDRGVTPGQSYWYKLVDVSYQGESTEHGPVEVLPLLEEVPSHWALEQNYPNPFNPTTIIRYQLPEESYVSLSIYNTQGQLVRTLVEDKEKAGDKSVCWDGRDSRGENAASGVYFYVLKVDGQLVQTRKMAVIR